MSTLTRDVQDYDMIYYFLADLLTTEFCTSVLSYADIYTVTNVPVALSLLKQIIILTRVENHASVMHNREMLIESKRELLLLKGNITEFNQWVQNKRAVFMPRNSRQLTSSTTYGRNTKQPLMKGLSCISKTSRANPMVAGLHTQQRISWSTPKTSMKHGSWTKRTHGGTY